MNFLLAAATTAPFLLAALRRRTSYRLPPLPLDGGVVWIMGGLTLLVLFFGLLLLFLALLTNRAQQLDEPPPHLNGERAAREGVWIAWSGLLFFAIAFIAWRARTNSEGLLVPTVAALVMAGWGGGRVLLASGGARHTSMCLFAGGLGVVVVATATLCFEMFVAGHLP